MKIFETARRRLVYSLLVATTITSHVCLAFNNDGKTDILWRPSPGSYSMLAWCLDGTTYLESWGWSPDLADSNWKIVGVGDINRDGSNDVLWRHQTTGLNSVWFSGSSSEPGWIQSVPDTNWEIVGTGYFNGYTDKNIDILWRHKVTGDNAIWTMEGTSLVASALIQDVTDSNWRVGGTGDFNNDGYTDILWRHYGTGQNWIWFMNGSTLLSSVQIQSSSDLNWESVGAGHFNLSADNKVDILWRHKVYGYNAVWLMNGTSYITTANLPWADPSWKIGGTGDSKIDADGDTLPDLWERRFFGNLNQTSSGDPDGDGESNLGEYIYGRDPTFAGGTSPTGFGNALESPELAWASWTVSNSGSTTNWVNNWTVVGPDSGSLSPTYGRSGSPVQANHDSYLGTSFSGPGVLLFYWKIYGNYVTMTVDGSTVAQASGTTSWQLATVNVGPGSHTFMAKYSAGSNPDGWSDAAYLDVVRFTPDSDLDGLGDPWEMLYFGSLAQGPGEDPDGDGLTNLQEYQAGKNPMAAEGSFAEIPKWSMYADASDYSEEWPPYRAIDGSTADPGWSYGYHSGAWLRLDLGSAKNVGRLKYASRQYSWDMDGTINHYEIFVTNSSSTAPLDWGQPAASGYWDWLNGPETKVIDFPPKTGRYVILRAVRSLGYATAANEIWLYSTTAFPPSADTDVDGLPDSWEQQYFGNLNQSANNDPDGDGFTNVQEYLGGSNPNVISGLQIFTPLK